MYKSLLLQSEFWYIKLLCPAAGQVIPTVFAPLCMLVHTASSSLLKTWPRPPPAFADRNLWNLDHINPCDAPSHSTRPVWWAMSNTSLLRTGCLFLSSHSLCCIYVIWYVFCHRNKIITKWNCYYLPYLMTVGTRACEKWNRALPMNSIHP